MQNTRINELLRKTLTTKDLVNLAQKISDEKVLLTFLQNHPNIDFEAIEISGTGMRHQIR